MHFPFAIVRYDMKTQPASIPFDFKSVRSFSDLGQRSLAWNVFYFLSDTVRPGCNADNHFDTVTLCVQNISKFIAKQMSKNLISH